ncbi:H+transporting two-sector ATPase B/B' subunit [Methylocella silvestris BL2]|uniref:ATP synthase subunit b n=1 Tax=Methylocella silvestris (strain DSM 15510 / CIP 108128 / LMG 27833 / NCIMB 13906 / BL2) TaxID=395965 RepID=B8EMM2_METSB|nr:F0F1 ATP synthase subunit B [Methylocella silvestris]ACK52701.1 H+transporting two-sector ATPase B/B' subunit [Methylocella silvestris BL2]
MLNEETFVAFGFLLLVGLFAYLGVHKKIAGALDSRGERIKGELAEAQRLRAEAEAVLASFGKRLQEAEAEAAAVVAQAHAEADRLAKEAATRLTEFVERRTKQAQEKIAAAEAQATADVRAAAADAATKAAGLVLKEEAKGPFGEQLVSSSINDLKSLFH